MTAPGPDPNQPPPFYRYPPPHYPSPPPPAKKSWVWKPVLGITLAIFVAAVIGSQEQTRSGSNPAIPSVASAAAGPVNPVTVGTYEVGNGPGQVAPGKYSATGPDGTNFVGCYYGRLRNNDGSIGDIIHNRISQGPALLTVQASDGYVEVSGCSFTKTG